MDKLCKKIEDTSSQTIEEIAQKFIDSPDFIKNDRDVYWNPIKYPDDDIVSLSKTDKEYSSNIFYIHSSDNLCYIIL